MLLFAPLNTNLASLYLPTSSDGCGMELTVTFLEENIAPNGLKLRKLARL